MKNINEIVTPMDQGYFVESIEALSTAIYTMAQEKGWYDEPREIGTVIALMHSELSEALEAMRTGNAPSEKIPEFSGAEEELADTVIRIMDTCKHLGLRLGPAILAKVAYNSGRSHRHGGKAF